ncbi:MAG TPA: hypothetical protein VKZ77_02530 [Bacillaceae bacterium]|nr:hypothetical protein [Paenibacillus bovis]HLU21339.1 hypothetical protein [Bacillaceae bacterium]
MFPWGKYPFNNDIQKLMQQLNPEDVHSFVNETMKNVMKGQQQVKETEKPPANSDVTIFESFDDVFIQIKLPAQMIDKEIKVYHTSNIVYIENLDQSGKKKITLPCLVKKKGAVAQIRDNILQLQIPKSNDFQFTEIAVTDEK